MFTKKSQQTTNLSHVPALLLNIREKKLEMPTIIPSKKGKRKKKKKKPLANCCVSDGEFDQQCIL